MKYPALEVRGADGAFALAAAADHAPTAAEERDDRLIIFFTNPIDRDRARASIAGALPQAHLAPHEVDDEDWARRSQEPLNPVTVGRIVVAPPGRPEAAPPGAHLVLIQPSTGFGTGHHATTRLCLAGLQRVPLEGRFVLDIGTGSGVLAIAARRLGARAALGVDWDPDAVRAARENVSRNPDLDHVRVELGDLTGSGVQGPADGVQPGTADVVTANLTGWLLARRATALIGLVRDGGALVVSGLLEAERHPVIAAFAAAAAGRGGSGPEVVWEAAEDGWVGLVLRVDVTPRPTETPAR